MSTGKASVENLPSNAGGTSRQRDRDHEYFVAFPNRWAFIRNMYLRDFALEALGIMMIIIFGAGSACQVVLSTNPEVASSQKGSYISIAFGYAIGVSFGIWVASASGGHINPAVTISFAVFRGFPWKKVPIYLAGQLFGGWMGCLIIYANYFHAIKIVDPDLTKATASLFATYALDYLPGAACFFSEFLGTAMLLFAVLAATDKNNGPPPAGLVPLVVFIAFLGIGVSLGMQTAFGVNPARDLGPRIALSMVGYSKAAIWDYRHQYWLWTPILGPIFGGLAATGVYDLFIYTGEDSIVNKPNAAARLHSERRTGMSSGGGRGTHDIV